MSNSEKKLKYPELEQSRESRFEQYSLSIEPPLENTTTKKQEEEEQEGGFGRSGCSRIYQNSHEAMSWMWCCTSTAFGVLLYNL